jgi:AraC-like DNA-binding protein
LTVYFLPSRHELNDFLNPAIFAAFLIFRDSHLIIRVMRNATTPANHGLTQSAATARAHLTAVSSIPAVLERLGVPSGPLLQQLHLHPDDFSDPERSATFEELDRLPGACVRRTGCRHFGLLVGQSIGLESLGIAGRLARNAASVARALADLEDFFILHDSGAVPHAAVRGDLASFSYSIHATGMRNADQVYDLALAAMLNIMRQLCGAGWRPDAALLPRGRPANIRPYREALQAPLRFDAMQAALVFPSTWLQRSIPGADPLLHRLLEDRAASDRAQVAPILHNEVRRVIRAQLATGDCCRAAVARKLNLHPRTLVRRLNETGTSYQALLDDMRAQVAKQLLHDTRSPVSRIAVTLGYGDPTVFTRAFRRWTGLSPREFRAALPERW